MKLKHLMFALVALLLLTNVGCATRIGPGHVGIKIDLAGSQRGAEDMPLRTGWVFYNFMSSTIIEYPTSVQTAKWTKDANEGKENVNEEMSFNTKDGLTVYGDLSISYHLEASKVPQFYVKFRTDDIDHFTHGYLRNVARDAINRTGSNFTVQEIMGEKKSELETDSRKDLQAQVQDIGVVIDQFGFIGSPRPPESVIVAINAKVQAQQIAVQKQNELVQSQADAAKLVAKSEGEAKAQVALANGEAEANRIRSASINENIIKWQQLAVTDRWISRWNGEVPKVQTGNTPGMLLNISPEGK